MGNGVNSMEEKLKRESNKGLYREIKQGREARMLLSVPQEDGSLREYVRLFVPHQRLILLGGGHIAAELCSLAARLDFEVTVADDRREFASPARFPEAAGTIFGDYEQVIESLKITPYDYVAIMTRGHAHDSVCLRKVLSGQLPCYLGMVGSRRKTALVRQMLTEEGFGEELLGQVHAPIGLEIGARTPAEIAVSILAQLIQVRNRGRQDKKSVMTFHNSDEKLLRYLAETTKPYILATVLEKTGSAPVADGAMMAVDDLGIAAGTVGGGRGEFEVFQEAKRLLETGESRLIQVSMTNRDAAGDGMICGGTLKLWLEYF